MDCEACGGLDGQLGHSHGHFRVIMSQPSSLLSLFLKLRIERSITIFDHPEEGEKQSNHLAEGSVNIVNGLITTFKSSKDSNMRTEIGFIRCTMEN